jgi:uncharacterized protein DUF3786
MVWDSELGNSPNRVSEILARIYKTEFGGKRRGRFRTSRNNFRKIANVPLLTDEYVQEVSLWLRKRDMILIDLDNAFCVFPLSSTGSFRRVPETVIASYAEPDEGGFTEPAARQCRAGMEKAWQDLSKLEPGDVCRRAQAHFNESSGIYNLKSYGQDIYICTEDRDIFGHSPQTDLLLNRLGPYSHISILNYLTNAKDMPLSGRLIKPRDLSGAKIFSRGAHFSPQNRMTRKYGSDPKGFLKRGSLFGGEPSIYGDASVQLHPFPGVPVVVILWTEDEEFPSRADLLLDSTCEEHLPTDIIWMTVIMSLLIMTSNFEGG